MDQEGWLGQNSSANVFPNYCTSKEAGRIIPWNHSIHGIIEEMSPCDREDCENGMNGDSRRVAFNFERNISGHFLSDFAHNCWSTFNLSIFNASQRIHDTFHSEAIERCHSWKSRALVSGEIDQSDELPH